MAWGTVRPAGSWTTLGWGAESYGTTTWPGTAAWAAAGRGAARPKAIAAAARGAVGARLLMWGLSGGGAPPGDLKTSSAAQSFPSSFSRPASRQLLPPRRVLHAP